MTRVACYLNHDVPMLTTYPYHRQYNWLLCYMFSPHITEYVYMLITEIGFPRLVVSHNDIVCASQMMRVELVKFNKRYGFAKMRGTCHVGANLVCEADLNLVMGK